MKSNKSRGSSICLATVILLLLAGAGYVYLSPPGPLQSVKLSTGETLDMFFLAYSNELEVDIRTPEEKLREMLPVKWQTALNKTFPPRRHSTWISMSNVKAKPALCIGLMYRDITGPKHTLYNKTTWVLSDDNGWYDSGIHGGSILDDNIVCRIFTHVPFTSPLLKLSVYSSNIDDVEPKEFLGEFRFNNPAYDKSLQSLTASPVPATATTETVTLKLHRFVTGIHLPDVPVFLYNTFLHRLNSDIAGSVGEIISGNPHAAKFPKTTRSALVFTPVFKSGNSVESLRNAKLDFTNSRGETDPGNLSVTYVTSNSCCMIFDHSLPVTNGNYTFELTLYEDPPADDASWVSVAAITPGLNDSESTKVVYLDGNKIDAGMTSCNDRINILAKEDPSLLSLRAEITGTSEPLTISPLQGGMAGAPFASYIQLEKPVSSGTITLSFAKTIEHKVTFEGVPEVVN